MTPSDDGLVTLVRRALAETPAAPTTTDPLGALDRRIHRARVRLAVGTGMAVAAVAAAVLVPLATLGSDRAGKVEVGVSPTPSASTSPSVAPLPGVERLWTNGASWVSGVSGQAPWFLVQNDDGTAQVAPVGAGGAPVDLVRVPSPADYVLAGKPTTWVIGSSDNGTTSWVTAIDSRSHGTMANRFDGRVFTYAATTADSLYVVAATSQGTEVDRFRVTADGNDIELVSTTRVSQDTSQVVATPDGHVWVHAGAKLVELVPTANGVDFGASGVWGTGAIFSATGDASGTLWAYDGGRVVALSPKLLQAGTSVAEGTRVGVAGRPGQALSDANGGLYVAVVEPGDGWDGHKEIGVYYYSPTALRDGSTPVTDLLPGVQVISMAIDPAGGVDYVDDAGTLNHWDPAGGSR